MNVLLEYLFVIMSLKYILTVFHRFLGYFMSMLIPLSGMKLSDYADS